MVHLVTNPLSNSFTLGFTLNKATNSLSFYQPISAYLNPTFWQDLSLTNFDLSSPPTPLPPDFHMGIVAYQIDSIPPSSLFLSLLLIAVSISLILQTRRALPGPRPKMSPNDSGGEDDFVLVDEPERKASSENVIGDSPFENDYVTVHANDLIMPATQDTPTAAPLTKCDMNILQMEKFEPIFLRMFPKQMKQVVLMAPLPTNDKARHDEVNGQPRASHPHKILIKNAILLFECFLHFKALYPKIGRDLMLYIVARACEDNAEDAIILQQLADRTIRTVARSREMFLSLKQDFSLPNAEDSDVRELAWLAESYIYFLPPEEPHWVEKNWHEDEAVDTLWREWQGILKKKGLRVNEAKINLGKEDMT